MLLKKNYDEILNYDNPLMFNEMILSIQDNDNELTYDNWLFEKIELQPDQKVLELGCGSGSFWLNHQESIINHQNISICDMDEEIIEKGKTCLNEANLELDIQLVNFNKLPYENNTFDKVIADHVFYHLKKLDAVLDQIMRVLKPGGKLLATSLGENHIRVLENFLQVFDDRISLPTKTLKTTFGVGSGAKKLSQYGSLKIEVFDNVICYNSGKDIYDLVMKLKPYSNIENYINEYNKAKFISFVDQIIENQGVFAIEIQTILFEVTK